jgi:CTP synthase (UTP-ammonia lyase)
VNTTGRIVAVPGSGFAARLGGPASTETYHCNYGLNPALEKIFHGSAVEFVAHDEQGQIRAFQLRQHPFFVGTLFQPERRALTGALHPLVRAFFQAA